MTIYREKNYFTKPSTQLKETIKNDMVHDHGKKAQA